MQKTIFHRLNSVLWSLIVTLVVLLAIYVSVGRLLVSSLGSYQAVILSELNYRVPFTIEAGRVSGEWQSFTPIIVLDDLRLSVPGSDLPPLTLSEGRVGVDVFNSLRTRTLQMTRLDLDGLELRGELTEEGRLRIRGFEGGGEIGDWLREFILNIELVALRHNKLRLELPGGEERTLDVFLRLEREGSFRRLQVDLESSRGARIGILGEGVGNPLETNQFTGEIYASINTGDLGAVKQMLVNQLPGVWADGSLDLEIWLSMERGQSELQGRLLANDLLVRDDEQAWQLPLDRVELAGELVQGGDRWTLYATGLQVAQGDTNMEIPRLQLDAWGRALRIRATEVPLAPVSAILTGEDGPAGKLADVFRRLAPAGTVSSLQLSAGDLREPAADWEVEARFRDLQVDSWRGAPGVTSASGHLQMIPGSGQVLLDSRDLTLVFPNIYDQPLDYSDFHGALHMAWGEEIFRLTSDLITAEGKEGRAQVLFGLDIPLVKSDIGLEMDLLVGLENSHPVHRVKYVPNVLNPALRDWLNDSIGDGVVEQGAFLWRGALKKQLPEMRTIQLAFNLRDTAVDYHPRWPAVSVREGIVLIDDSNVSVWANEADLFQSSIKRLSVESWLGEDKQMMLAVDGRMRGPASDGLVVINASPINDLVKGAFKEWSLEGDLEVDLKLGMNLTDSSEAPRVDVATRWQQVAMDIRPGELPLRDITGQFNYNSSLGFSSSGLQGTLWGKPLKAEVFHPGKDGGEEYKPSQSVTGIRVDTRADMADIRRWLNFDALAFATGETAAVVRLDILPGEPPLLKVNSDLRGVGLDFPRPWRKEAGDAREFGFTMALGAEGEPLRLVLGEDLALNLDLRQGALYSGALGIAEPPASLQKNLLRVTGHTPLVQGDEWTEFITRYFVTDPEAVEAAAEDPNAPPGQQDAAGLAIDVEEIRTESMEIWGQTLSDVEFSLRVDGEQWHLRANTDWLEGEYLRVNEREKAVLVLNRLDLEGLQTLSLDDGSGQGQAAYLQVPTMNVSILDLQRGDFELGTLSFDLRSEGATLFADDISGVIAGLRLGSPGALRWQQADPVGTRLDLGLEFDDLGAVLGRVGYEKIVETRDGRFSLDLEWPGAPQGFSLAEGEGAVMVAIGEGRFLEAPSGASGALKVVNILNLADIVQRLSLSHMFESGIPFDSVEGEVFLHSGAIEVAGMEVKGPSSFHFSGIADVGARSLDGELVATLPVANNLPWVAALTASLPIAAGVFVVSKLLQKQVDRLSSAVYSIAGSWDDPQVKFEHIFDSSGGRAKGAENRAAMARAASAAMDPNSPSALVPVAPDPQAPDQVSP